MLNKYKTTKMEFSDKIKVTIYELARSQNFNSKSWVNPNKANTKLLNGCYSVFIVDRSHISKLTSKNLLDNLLFFTLII